MTEIVDPEWEAAVEADLDDPLNRGEYQPRHRRCARHPYVGKPVTMTGMPCDAHCWTTIPTLNLFLGDLDAEG